jgi:hypothetical protein
MGIGFALRVEMFVLCAFLMVICFCSHSCCRNPLCAVSPALPKIMNAVFDCIQLVDRCWRRWKENNPSSIDVLFSSYAPRVTIQGPNCKRPIPVLQIGPENAAHIPDMKIECFEKLSCKWKGSTTGMSPVRSLPFDWSDD